MKRHRTALALAVLTGLMAISRMRLEGAAASPQIAQAFVGFNKSNDVGLPCVSPCLGIPTGTVLVQPNHFVTSGSTGLYYAVFQLNGFAGELSANFELTVAGSVAQNMTIKGSSAAAQGSLLVLSGGSTIPQTSHVGPAELLVTTTATPTGGGAPIILTSYAELQVGKAGIRRLVQVFAGVNAPNNGFFPCSRKSPYCPYPLPPGAVGVQPNQFLSASSTSGPGTAYAVFQSDGYSGGPVLTFDVIEAGRIVETMSASAIIVGAGVWVADAGWAPYPHDYVGPATMRVTTVANLRPVGSFTLKSNSSLEMVP